jgi:hypothetical protein
LGCGRGRDIERGLAGGLFGLLRLLGRDPDGVRATTVDRLAEVSLRPRPLAAIRR